MTQERPGVIRERPGVTQEGPSVTRERRIWDETSSNSRARLGLNDQLHTPALTLEVEEMLGFMGSFYK